MLQHQNYTRDVEPNQEEALSKIVAKVPHRAVVLDIGCGAGMMGRYLGENNECIVDGVDIDPDAVAIARPKYRTVGVFDLEKDSLLSTFKAEAYDCIVMADVIEHLVHPEQLFEDVKKLLKPDGILLFSIPNITHLSAGLELVLGKFAYQNSGLLDATHVRFYSRSGFIEKLESCGIYVEDVDTVKRDVDKAEFQGYKSFPKEWIRDIVRDREDALTYQWIMSARLFKTTLRKSTNPAVAAVDSAYLSLNSRLYWRTASDDSFSELNSMAGQASVNSAGENFLNFKFTDDNCRYPIKALRIDPLSDTSVVVVYDAVFTGAKHQVLWSTNQFLQQDVVNADVVAAPSGEGFILAPKNSDPQWIPKFEADVFNAVSPGCVLRIRVKTSSDAACQALFAAFQSSKTELAEKTVEVHQLSSERDLKSLQADQTAAIASDFQTRLTVAVNALSVLSAERDLKSLQASQTAAIASDFQTRLTVAVSALSDQTHRTQELELTQRSTENQLADCTGRLRSTESQLADCTGRLRSTESQLADCTGQLQMLEAVHHQTLKTLSWRITSPLRWIRRLLR
jgi:2-polyprenyl-3-methyl-5-hydroxy-6-metoxy-1,4-benzoquinol methylase